MLDRTGVGKGDGTKASGTISGWVVLPGNLGLAQCTANLAESAVVLVVSFRRGKNARIAKGWASRAVIKTGLPRGDPTLAETVSPLVRAPLDNRHGLTRQWLKSDDDVCFQTLTAIAGCLFAGIFFFMRRTWFFVRLCPVFCPRRNSTWCGCTGA